MPTGKEGLKLAAAKEALKYVGDGMVIGLGTGTTAALFIQELAKSCENGKMDITCVPTSSASGKLAKECGLVVKALDGVGKIDLAVDGADQIDARRNLIKGHGGALAREKVIDYAAVKFIVIADSSKISNALDMEIPVEALPFTFGKLERDLKSIGAKSATLRLREDGEPFVSDNGLWIWDVNFGKITDPCGLEERINEIPGVLENGLFTHPVWKVLVAEKGGVREL